ncbi:MAG: ABC transporter permease [Clostridiaceae bacterium]|nr:ABC transporter permease [Clostridiaceae bacterium]
MKNPLHKRLPREFFGEFAKYLVIFLFMTATIGFVSGFLVAGESMMTAYDQSFEKYHIEDGHFEVDSEPEDSFFEQLEDGDITVYPNLYQDEAADCTMDGETNCTIRIFEERTDVNLVCLMDGALPEKEGEIALDRMFAENNNLEVGSEIMVGSRKQTVTGLVALSDYSALFSDNSDMMFDSIQFGVAVVTDAGFASFSGDNLRYSYAWKYSEEPEDEIQEKEWSDAFMETLAEAVFEAQLNLENYIPRYSNQAIQFTGDDMGGDQSMMLVLLYILIVILAFVFSVTIRHTIEREAAVIGTLRASGYTKAELFWHYMTTPMLVTLLAAAAGNVLGYTVFKNIVASLYYASYSLTAYQTIWNGNAFLLTTVVPLLIMLAANSVSLLSMLRLTPLQFIRRDLGRKTKQRAVKLPDFKFIRRFRIRIILQNKSSYLTLFVGIVFADVLLLFGMMMTPLLSNYQETATESRLADYQYILKTQVGTNAKHAEKFCLTSLDYNAGEKKEQISVYGIQENSRYLEAELPAEGVCISDGFAEKYQVREGEMITLQESYGSETYSFRVQGVIDYPGALAVFMLDKQFVTVFDAKIELMDTAADIQLVLDRLFSPSEQYFNGYLSDQEITDIDDKYIDSCITVDDLTKLSRQLNTSMGDMFYLVDVFAVALAALLIYLLTKLILERNTNSISMVKILGYRNGEIARLYLLATTWMVVLSMAAGCVLATVFIKEIYRFFMSGFSGWLACYIAPEIYPEMFLLVMFVYSAVALLQFRRIQKIPMDEALKNAE